MWVDGAAETSPLIPDFRPVLDWKAPGVVKVHSRSDRLPPLQRRMADYIANGAVLGWLIDPYQRRIHICRPGAEPEALDDPETVSGDPELPGFAFEVRRRTFYREGVERQRQRAW